MKNVQKWLVKNKLSLHLGKTKPILFGTKRKLNVNDSLNVECQGKVMASKDKFLGVTLDPHLSGTTMANSVIGKGNRGLRILYKKPKFFKFVENGMFILIAGSY